MTDNATDNPGAQPDDKSAAQPAAKGGMLKKMLPMLAFVGGGLTLLAIAVAATLYLMGGKTQTADVTDAPSQDSTVVAEKPAAKAPSSDPLVSEMDEVAAALDSLEAAADSVEALDALVRNIALMDNSNDTGANEQYPLTTSDSATAAGWLTKEQEKLAARTTELDSRERDLQKRETEISQKVLKLEQASSDRITNLAKLYDGMDASAVAKILENLDDETVVALIPRMKPKTASQVLALMPPPRAAKLSKQIITLASD